METKPTYKISTSVNDGIFVQDHMPYEDYDKAHKRDLPLTTFNP